LYFSRSVINLIVHFLFLSCRLIRRRGSRRTREICRPVKTTNEHGARISEIAADEIIDIDWSSCCPERRTISAKRATHAFPSVGSKRGVNVQRTTTDNDNNVVRYRESKTIIIITIIIIPGFSITHACRTENLSSAVRRVRTRGTINKFSLLFFTRPHVRKRNSRGPPRTFTISTIAYDARVYVKNTYIFIYINERCCGYSIRPRRSRELKLLPGDKSSPSHVRSDIN